MDHHCRKQKTTKPISRKIIKSTLFFSLSAWINNCVGFGNHRYFFLFMVYTVIGSLFLIIFGFELAYNIVWLHDEEWTETEPLIGNVVTFNFTGHIVPIVRHYFAPIQMIEIFLIFTITNQFLLFLQQSEMNEYQGVNIDPTEESLQQTKNDDRLFQRRAITFMGFINVGK